MFGRKKKQNQDHSNDSMHPQDRLSNSGSLMDMQTEVTSYSKQSSLDTGLFEIPAGYHPSSGDHQDRNE